MKQTEVYKFFYQVYQEARKITWPDKKELVNSVVIIVAAVFICSFLSLVLDYSIHIMIKFFLNFGK